ncbi:MAG: hypothetical protein HY782_27830 [Chloroflexi bacterium]|nr:hypothetical protein [Chloroflexota bacterium]
MERCIHHLLREQCAECREFYTAPRPRELRLFSYRPSKRLSKGRQNKRLFGITLGKEFGSGRIKVFLNSKTDCYRSFNESEIHTKAIGRLSKNEQRKMRVCLRKLAIRAGLLFVPEHPLTQRELNPEIGPYQCPDCGTILSLAEHALGCLKCNYYVCSEGFCMCGSPGGINYLGQYFPPQPKLPIALELREACVKVILNISLTGDIQKPKQFERPRTTKKKIMRAKNGRGFFMP